MPFFITEIFRHRKRRKCNTRTRSWRLIHLTEHKSNLRVLIVVLFNNASFHHLMVKVVTLASTLTNTTENRHTAVAFRDIVDQFLNSNCLTNTSATEETDLTTLCIRTKKVNNLNTSHKLLNFCRLIFKRRRIAVNWPICFCINLWTFINRITSHIQNTRENLRTNRHRNRIPCIKHFLTANKTICHVHRNRTNCILTKVLSSFKNKRLTFVTRIHSLKRVQDRWNFTLIESHINNRTRDLRNHTTRTF